MSARDSTMLDRLRQARRVRDEVRGSAEEAFAEQIREAMRDREGHQVREIAAAAGLSRERLYQIASGRIPAARR